MKKNELSYFFHLRKKILKILLAMKIMIFLTSFFAVALNASVFPQATKISIEVKDQPVREILQKIEEKSEYRFFYNDQLTNLDNRINYSAKNISVFEVISDLLEGQELAFKLMENNLVLVLPESIIKQKFITGTVTDPNGDPLVGVTVVIRGTIVGVITDINGEYTIQVPEQAEILVFSYVGMITQEIEIGNQTTINVTMFESTVGLDEVVVIGYGIVKKRNLTSSITKINSDALDMGAITTVSEALSGQLSGVRAQHTTGMVGSELQIRIRGVNTINGNSSPLYVIDGIPRDDMQDLNPGDIESIQILKDASASSIYGSRGGNGVVLIQTKKGTGKPMVNFNSYYGFQEAEKYMEMMNKDEYLAYNIWYKNVSWLQMGGQMSDPMSARPIYYQIPDSWLDPNLKDTDWQDAILQKAPIQSYQLSASSKNDKGSLYISGAYLNQDGIVYNTYYKRINFRFNGVVNVNDKLQIGVGIAPSYSDKDLRQSEGKELSIHHALGQSPLIQLNQATRDWGYPDGFFGAAYPNPLEQLKETIDNTRSMNLSNNVWGQWEIIKDLTFKSQFGYDYSGSEYEFFQPANVTYLVDITLGNSKSYTRNNISIQNTLTYDKTLNDHYFNLIVGQAVLDNRYFEIEAESSNWPNENLQTLNLASTPITASTYKTRNVTESFFGRVNYIFKDKYLLNASLRYDGSSRFGSNNKWGQFPSLSIGWKINEESFMEQIKWISLLKIRAAWGIAGNDRIGDYDYLSKLIIDNTSWGGDIVSGVRISNIENQELKWEETQTVDLGIDFSGFKNRAQLNFDYYINKTERLLFNEPIPTTSGFSSIRTNIGSIENRGWELDLTTINTTGKVKWTTVFNLSKEKNKVLDMGSSDQFVSSLWDSYFITEVGGPVSQFLAYETNGLLTEADFDDLGNALIPIFPGQKPGNIRYVDQNNDGMINSDDLKPMGTNIPDFIFGFTSRVSWNNFELSCLFEGQVGGKVLFLGQRSFDSGYFIMNQMKRWLRQWKPDYEALYGPDNDPYPDLGTDIDWSWDGKTPYVFNTQGDNNNDTRIYNSSYGRIKNITLSYEIPNSFSKLNFIQNANLYISVDNLKTFTNYPGFTPESNSIGNTTTQMGVDYSCYPLARKYTIGLRLTL